MSVFAPVNPPVNPRVRPPLGNQRYTYRDYFVRARRVMGMRWSYDRLYDVLIEHTGFPFVGMRLTMQQLRQFKRGECACPGCDLL